MGHSFEPGERLARIELDTSQNENIGINLDSGQHVGETFRRQTKARVDVKSKPETRIQISGGVGCPAKAPRRSSGPPDSANGGLDFACATLAHGKEHP